MIVGKAVNLAKSLEVPVVGLVENMAYFKCDDCGKEHHIFGEPQGAAGPSRGARAPRSAGFTRPRKWRRSGR